MTWGFQNQKGLHQTPAYYVFSGNCDSHRPSGSTGSKLLPEVNTNNLAESVLTLSMKLPKNSRIGESINEEFCLVGREFTLGDKARTPGYGSERDSRNSAKSGKQV